MKQEDAVLSLLAKPEAEWTRDELSEACKTLMFRHSEAIEGWGKALELHEAVKAELELLRKLRALEVEIKKSTSTPAQAKKVRGRPRKHDDSSYLLEWHEAAIKKYGNISVTSLLTAYFKDEFKRRGLRESRADDKSFQVKLNSIRKLLSKERNKIVVVAKKGDFYDNND